MPTRRKMWQKNIWKYFGNTCEIELLFSRIQFFIKGICLTISNAVFSLNSIDTDA